MSDRRVLKYVFFHKYHLPPIDLAPESTILDLGANIGLTVVHFKHLYPESKIIAYEMDSDNFLLAKKNCNNLENCTIINQAVWIKQGIVKYYTDKYEDAYKIDKGISNRECEEEKIKQISAVSILDIIKNHDINQIDYLKMDIEGAEIDILKNKDLRWTEYVNCLNIEVHSNDFLQEGIKILASEGYKCWKDTKHPCAIMAVKEKVD